MILAAGRGTRMQPKPDDPPKPLIEIAGQSLLARMMDRLIAARVSRIIVNVHHKAEMIEAALQAYQDRVELHISDEREALLETGGGVKNALPLIGDKPFFVCNADILWQENSPALAGLAQGFDAARMDGRLLLAARATGTGYDGAGDFDLLDDGRLRRRDRAEAPYIFAGVQILTPAIFADMNDTAFSLNLAYDAGLARGRLHGAVLDGVWMHVGTPEGRQIAEHILTGDTPPAPPP
jgi:MurNAc alpha-1-phosphate uridylyltransferase